MKMLKQLGVAIAKGMMCKRTAVAAGCLVLALGSASALGGKGADVQRDTPVGFTLTSDICPNLPPNMTITASGTQTSITTTRTNAAGVTTIINTTHSVGKATDQNGNTYTWDYSNHSNVSNTVAAPDVFSGQMADHFSLAGNGPARLSNGFLGEITFDPNAGWPFGFSIQPVHSYGDPISFPFGDGPYCDPL